jgi:hypothetical protein
LFSYKVIFCLIPFPAHDWVREGGKASEIPLDISVLHNMRQFVKYSRFKQFALRVSKKARIYVYVEHDSWVFEFGYSNSLYTSCRH